MVVCTIKVAFVFSVLLSWEAAAVNIRLIHSTLLTDALDGGARRLIAGGTYVVQGGSQDPAMNTPVSSVGILGAPLILGASKENTILDTVGLQNAYFMLGNSSFLSYFCSASCSGVVDLAPGANNATLRITGSYTFNAPLPGGVTLQLAGSGQVLGGGTVLMSPLQVLPGADMKLDVISVILKTCGSGASLSFWSGDKIHCP